jgi:hypothetical protein
VPAAVNYPSFKVTESTKNFETVFRDLSRYLVKAKGSALSAVPEIQISEEIS